MTLEEKLIKSTVNIERLLDKDVKIKLVCKINNNILLDSNRCLPCIDLKKEQIGIDMINLFNNLLNISINNISMLPFEKYNNFDERYYNVEIDEDDIINLNNNFSFYSINNMFNDIEREIIS